MEDNPVLWKSIVAFCMCLDMVSTQFLWDMIQLNFIIASLWNCAKTACASAYSHRVVVRLPQLQKLLL